MRSTRVRIILAFYRMEGKLDWNRRSYQSKGAENAVLSMADRQDLLLTGRVEDLGRKVFELAAIIGEPPAYAPDT
jgi:hypothetical protein